MGGAGLTVRLLALCTAGGVAPILYSPAGRQSATGPGHTFTGTDTLRVKDGHLAEYWANADSLLFLQQLGVETVPGTIRILAAN